MPANMARCSWKVRSILFDGEEKWGDFKPPKMYKTLVNNGINYNYLSLNWCRISSMNSILIIIISTNDDNIEG